VLNVPDLGKTPEVMDGLANGSDSPSATFDSLASSLASEYNARLATGLAAMAGANIAVVDTYQLIDDAVADPAAYGLANVTSPVWNGSYSVPGSGSLATTVPAQQDQYLFWDHVHPTETGEAAVAALGVAALALANATTITATTPGQVVSPAAGDTFVFATAPILVEQAIGASTVISNAGALTVEGSGGSNVVFDGGGGSTINEAPTSEYVGNPAGATSTVTAFAGGADTIFAGGPLLDNGNAGANSLFVGGTGHVTVVSAASETVFAGSGGGVYQPGASGFFFFGGGGTDTITGGAASPTVWGNSGESVTADSTAANGVFVAFGSNDSIDASAAGGGDTFFVVNEALTLPGGTFSGNTTLAGSFAGHDTLGVFSEGAAPPAHTITVEDWQASDTFYLGNYGAADLATAAAALAAAGTGGGASFTLSDQTTITFLAAHPSAVA
jgi:hypothetical protein